MTTPSILIFSSMLAATTPTASAPGSLHQAIEGGEVEAALPAVGRITIDHNPFVKTICSGTLVAPDVVLTAAHCIGNAGSITFDITTADGTTPARSFGVIAALAHPNYVPDDTEQAGDDIGVLLLDEEVPSDLAAPQPLHRTPLTDAIANTPILSVGFGTTRTEPPGTKRSVDLFIGGLSGDTYSVLSVDTTDAAGAGVVSIDKGVCPGDSGGPDLLRDDAGALRIVGVHSLGSTTCSLAVSTRIDRQLEDFIDPALAGQVPKGCSGDSLADATCNAALEGGGCTASGSPSSWALVAALGLALRRRRR